MTYDDCDFEKDNGEPCQLPGSRPDGRCHHHTETGEQATGGRPSKLEDAWEEILEAAQRGLTFEGIARSAGIGVSTLRDWRQEHDDFSAALSRARAKAERKLVDAVAEDDPRFLLERSYGYTKKEEIEHSGGGLTVQLSSDDE